MGWGRTLLLGDIGNRLDIEDAFTEGRTPREWIEQLWQFTVDQAAEAGVELPTFQVFWGGGPFTPPEDSIPERLFDLENFRNDPQGAPLPTPSSGPVVVKSHALSSMVTVAPMSASTSAMASSRVERG